MKCLKFIFLFSVLFCACKEAKNENHKNLAYFQSRFMAEGNNEHKRLLKLAESNFEIKYLDDFIYVSKYVECNACGEYEGDIKIVKDSIYLVYKFVGKEACTSQRIDKLTYLIENLQNKKYKFAMKYK